MRSSRTSCPTMVRLTSNSKCSSGWADSGGLAGVIMSFSSYLGPVVRRAVAVAAAQGHADRHRERDAGERVVASRVGDRDDDPDDQAARVQERTAGAARVDGGVE